MYRSICIGLYICVCVCIVKAWLPAAIPRLLAYVGFETFQNRAFFAPFSTFLFAHKQKSYCYYSCTRLSNGCWVSAGGVTRLSSWEDDHDDDATQCNGFPENISLPHLARTKPRWLVRASSSTTMEPRTTDNGTTETGTGRCVRHNNAPGRDVKPPRGGFCCTGGRLF